MHCRCCKCVKYITINGRPNSVGDGVSLVTPERNIKSLVAGDNIQILDQGDTVLISTDRSNQGTATTDDNSAELFSIPIQLGEAIAAKFIIIAAEQGVGEVAAYFINAVFKRMPSGIQRINLSDSSEFLEMMNTSVSFDLTSDISIVVASIGTRVNWSGSARTESVSF